MVSHHNDCSSTCAGRNSVIQIPDKDSPHTQMANQNPSAAHASYTSLSGAHSQ